MGSFNRCDTGGSTDALARRVGQVVVPVAVCIAMWSTATLRGQETRIGIAAGANHGVLLKGDGSVWTWGGNGYGQLGTDGDDRWTPVRVPGLGGVRSVAAGEHFTMVLKADGTVWTWGQNEYGELGYGSKEDSPRPAAVGGLPRIVAIAAAGHHSLALDSNGTVWGWGDVPNRSPVLVPQRVPDLANVVAIAAGDNHSIALDGGGTVWVWGDHGAGDLGDGCYNASNSPQRVRGLSDITAVAGGHELTLGLKNDGTVWAIGYGAAGQLGNGSTENSTKPVRVSGLSGVKSLAAGYMHVLALKGDGTVWSWGSNHERQLGNPGIGPDDSSKPVRSGTLTGVVAVAAAASHSAAVTGPDVVWTWGQNEGGALGADPESLDRSDTPMRAGQPVPAACSPLFACQTAGGKAIRICGVQDSADADKWTNIHYRFGPESGPPELMFPADPAKAPPSLFFYRGFRHREWLHTVRFSNGGYTYRVYYGAKSGGGVDVEDAKGKTLSSIECAERPQVYIEYLQMNLPCDPKNPRGAAGCKQGSAASK